MVVDVFGETLKVRKMLIGIQAIVWAHVDASKRTNKIVFASGPTVPFLLTNPRHALSLSLFNLEISFLDFYSFIFFFNLTGLDKVDKSISFLHNFKCSINSETL